MVLKIWRISSKSLKPFEVKRRDADYLADRFCVAILTEIATVQSMVPEFQEASEANWPLMISD